MNTLEAFRLDHQLAVVTGCRRGIGRAMALALAEAGADIAGVSAQMETEASVIGEDVRRLSRQFYPYRCDFRERKQVLSLAERLRNDFPRIDILINNAGMVLRKPAEEYPDSYWDEVIAVNQTAPFILAREIGRQMLSQGKGKIIFTASLMTFQGGITIPAYSASKGAIGSLVKALANEWAARGINVNAIAPGYIRTDNTSALMEDENRRRSISERIPAGRWGEPEDLKGATVFLASRASDYVHGTVLTVDGGWLGR
jgi:2-deoxy-D-gluconate 3-dehydrogenase